MWPFSPNKQWRQFAWPSALILNSTVYGVGHVIDTQAGLYSLEHAALIKRSWQKRLSRILLPRIRRGKFAALHMVRNVDTIGGGKVPCYFAGRPYSRCSSQNPDDGHCDPLSACPRMCSLVTAMLIRSSSSWWIISSASLIFCVYLEDIVIISKSHAEHLRSPTNFFYLTLQ